MRFGASLRTVGNGNIWFMRLETATIPATAKTQVARRRPHGFYVAMAIAANAVVLAGFAGRYYFLPAAGKAALPWIIHLHATVFSAWMLLFLVQTTLVTAGRADIHRKLGIAGAALAAWMVPLGVRVTIQGGRDGWAPGGAPDSLAFMVIGMGDMILFAGFVVAGLYFRRRSETHKRLMLSAVIGGLMWPAITRIPHVAGNLFAMFGLLALLVVAGPVFDLLAFRRVTGLDVWSGLLILGSLPARMAIAHTQWWHRFAAWLAGY